MTRPGIFGWSYPPGCSGPPEPDGPCDVCGAHVDECVCPECSFCGKIGWPWCYVPLAKGGHGLTYTKEQEEEQEKAKVEQDRRNAEDEAEAAFYAEESQRGRYFAPRMEDEA